MATYIRFQNGQDICYGRVEGDTVHTLDGDLFHHPKETGTTIPLADVTPLLPCTPSKVMAVGFNYCDHAAEFSTPIPTEPNIFQKPVSCLTAAGSPVYYPKTMGDNVEYEVELVIVIG